MHRDGVWGSVWCLIDLVRGGNGVFSGLMENRVFYTSASYNASLSIIYEAASSRLSRILFSMCYLLAQIKHPTTRSA